MIKSKITILIIALTILVPNVSNALIMPKDGNDLADMTGINAKAYIVKDLKSGEILISKNENLPWIPASLTKLVTALVVLDTKTKLNKTVAITKGDQIKGACASGGACIKAKPGVKFTVDALFHAALLPSANNATHALARSTGLTPKQFADKMNEKAKSLGAINSHFNEPTGLDTDNIITASDYTFVVEAAFKHPYLRKIAGLSKYYLRSTNNSKYNQTIKNTDKLLADSEIKVLGAKTGYLTESGYNFGSLVKFHNSQELVVIVLGEKHLYSAFAETKQLMALAEVAKAIALVNSSLVLGMSTQP